MGPLSAIFSAILAPFKAGGAIFGFIKNMLGGILGSIGRVLEAGLKSVFLGLGALVGGLALAFKAAVSGATEFGKAALALRASTGLGYNAAGKLLSKGLAFGLSPDESASSFGSQNPLIASMLGNNYQSGSYFSNLARERAGYANQGPMGLMMFQAIAKGRGVSDSSQQIAAMDPSKVAGQEKWVNRITSQLAMSGRDIAMYAEDFALAGNKVGTIFELLKLKLASAIGPQLIVGIERFAAFLAGNADRISNILSRIGGAVSTVLLQGFSVALGHLEANAGNIETFIYTAFNWLLLEFPKLILGWGSQLSGILGGIFGYIAEGTDRLVAIAPDIAAFFDRLAASVTEWIPRVLGAFDWLINGIRDFINGILRMVNFVQTSIEDFIRGLNAIPWLPSAMKIKQPEFNRLPDDILNGAPRSNMANDRSLIDLLSRIVSGGNGLIQGGLSGMTQHGPQIAAASAAAAKWFDEKSMTLGQSAEAMPNEILKLLQANQASLQSIDKSTKEVAESAKPNTRQITDALNVLARALAYAGQDAAYAVVE